MRCKLDENLPASAKAIFLDRSHEVDSVHDEGLEGARDTRIMDACRSESRVLFTLDSDFGDIRTYRPAEHAGVVVLRPPSQDVESILAMLQRAPQVLEAENPRGRLWIVDQTKIRMRE